MESASVLQISLLGGCTLTYGERRLDSAGGRGGKAWTLLEYLVTFRDREIPLQELFDLLYPESRGANPAGALKTLVYRVRELLEELGLPESRDRILMTRGSYAWNTALPLWLDAEEFERSCQRASSPWLLPEERLEACRSAAALYRGDYLAGSAGARWAAPAAAYYHTMYVHLVQSALELLAGRERWEEAAELCVRAIGIDAYQECFHFCLVRALARTGQTGQALERYRRMYSLFYTELGAAPPPELAALYREICRPRVGELPRDGGDLADISRFLLEEEGPGGAFLCELEAFRAVCCLAARSRSRDRRGICLALLEAAGADGSPPPRKLLNSYMDKLALCIRDTLRRGDVACKYSASQYVLLLPAVSGEACAAVLDRIIARFLDRHPRCPLVLRRSVRALEAPPPDRRRSGCLS